MFPVLTEETSKQTRCLKIKIEVIHYTNWIVKKQYLHCWAWVVFSGCASMSRSMTGWVFGEAGKDRASTMRTRMKFITLRLAGWLVRVSSWLQMRAGGGLLLLPDATVLEVSSENTLTKYWTETLLCIRGRKMINILSMKRYFSHFQLHRHFYI